MLDKTKLTESLAEYVDKSASSTIEETTDRLIAEKQMLLLAKLDQEDATVKGSVIREYFEDEQAKNMEVDVAAGEENVSGPHGRSQKGSSDAADTSLANDTSFEHDDDEEGHAPVAKKRRAAKPAPSKAKKASQSQSSRVHEMLELSSDDEEVVKPSVKASTVRNKGTSAARPARGAATKRPVYKLDSESDKDSDAVIEIDDDEEDAGFQQPKKRGRGNVATKSRSSPPGTQSRKSASKRRSRMMAESDDESTAGNGTESYENENWGSTLTKTQT